MSIITKVKHTIDKYNLIQSQDSILAALSGGPDSVALLHIINAIKKEYRITISAIYINHNLRPRASKLEEEFCQKLCDNLDVELILVNEDIKALSKKNKKGIEETARDFRYGVFEKLTDEYNFSKIALGHHSDDRVETILFRIIRGTGRSGLVGIKPKRGNIIRPLFDITKEEILLYLKQNQMKFCIDQSNKDTKFSRNFVRHKLLPYLRKNMNPAVDKALLNLSENSLAEEEYLEALTLKNAKKSIKFISSGKIELALERLNCYDNWLRRRILRYCLTMLSINKMAPDKQVIDRLEQKCLKGGKAISLPDKISAKIIDEKLVIYRKQKIAFSESIIFKKKSSIKELNARITVKIKKIGEIELNKKRRSFKVQLDNKKIIPPLLIRSIKAGDRFKPLGLSGTKKIGDYLTDKKVDIIYRDEIPVVCDNKGIIWLVGYEIDQRVKIDKSTKEVLEIEFFRSK